MENSTGLRKRSTKADGGTVSLSKKCRNTCSSITDDDSPDGLPTRLFYYLWEEEDASWLAVWRVCWAIIQIYEMTRFLRQGYQKHNWYFGNGWNMKFYGFEWVQMPPQEYVNYLFYTNIIILFFIMIGHKYRLSSFLYWISWTYIFCWECGNYLNHWYLISLLAFMMIFMPCNQVWSVDAWRYPPSSQGVPRLWGVFFRGTLIIVYTWAGYVKINEDWFRGEPSRRWLWKEKNMAVLGWTFKYDPVIYLYNFLGMSYDLLVGLLLTLDTTRPLGLVATFAFHITNHYVFEIGIFPPMMCCATFAWFGADWPRRALNFVMTIFHDEEAKEDRTEEERVMAKPSVYKPLYRPRPLRKIRGPYKKLTVWQKLAFLFVAIWVIFHLLVPLRDRFLYPGWVMWNEYGHKGAWRMKLRQKDCDGQMYGYQPVTNRSFAISDQVWMGKRQYTKPRARPEYAVQFAHWMRDEYTINGTQPELYFYVRGQSECRLNGRPLQKIYDPAYDMAKAPRWDWPYPFVVELEPTCERNLKELPWNWEWNFNWLKGINVDLTQQMTEDMAEWKQIRIRLRKEYPERFIKFIAEKHYNGNVEVARGHADLTVDYKWDRYEKERFEKRAAARRKKKELREKERKDKERKREEKSVAAQQKDKELKRAMGGTS